MRYRVTSPLKVLIGRDRKGKDNFFALNLNIYRNAHHFTNNKAKQLYIELMQEQLKNIPKLSKIELEYVLYAGSKRQVDLSNICSIVDKFFCDCLTHYQILEDDSIIYIPKITYTFGGVDKDNPRVEIYIKPII